MEALALTDRVHRGTGIRSTPLRHPTAAITEWRGEGVREDQVELSGVRCERGEGRRTDGGISSWHTWGQRLRLPGKCLAFVGISLCPSPRAGLHSPEPEMLNSIITALALLITTSAVAKLLLGARNEQKPSGETGPAIVRACMHDFIPLTADQRKPHADPADRSVNSITLDARVSELALTWPEDPEEEFELQFELRPDFEISAAADLFCSQTWYNGYRYIEFMVEEGQHKIVPESEHVRRPYNPDVTVDTVWTAALAAARRVEEEIGLDNLGPWTDFEWGMINGKLSALRWVQGFDWDMLDT